MRKTFYTTGFSSGWPDGANTTGAGWTKTSNFGVGRPTTAGGASAFQDGNILKDLENLTEDELKERLIVSEMIMKKLYERTKDLENII